MANNAARGSSPLIWLLGLVAMGGAAVVGLPRLSNQPQSATNTPAPTKHEPGPDLASVEQSDHLLDVLKDYLRVTAESSEETTKASAKFSAQGRDSSFSISAEGKRTDRKLDAPLSTFLKLLPARYEFLIVALPNPIETRLPHEFDAALDGIQRAFEARGFVYRTSRLPWPQRQNQEGANANANTPATRSERGRPGVLLFQHGPDEKEETTFALVYVVADSPISGIDKPALTEALSAREKLDKELTGAKSEGKICWQSPEGLIPIIGPFFSGSQSSLILTLKQWNNKKRELNTKTPRFQVISGSATALVPKNFCNAGFQFYPPDPNKLSDYPNVLSSTVIPDTLLTKGLLSYLTGNRSMNPSEVNCPINDRVAILQETNTVYGERSNVASQSHPNTDAQDCECPEDSFQKYIAKPVIFLPFPMTISQLQIDLDRNSKPGVAIPQTGFVEPRLSDSSRNRRIDAIPPYDLRSAASAAGENLRVILTTIKRASVRYVGIVATDARDVVFLNKLLRQECPDVRVFTTEPSIALLQPEDAYHLRGMLVGSTYPLDPITQYWARTPLTPHRMISFPTQGSQGYFNAVLAQFGRPDLMVGYHPPLIPEASKSHKIIPPIWISSVGNNGRLVPVHCFTNYEKNRPEDKGLVYPMTETQEMDAIYKTTGSDGPKPETVKFSENRPVVGVPVPVLLGSLGAILVLGWVIYTLSSWSAWHKWAAGVSDDEVKADKLSDADRKKAQEDMDRAERNTPGGSTQGPPAKPALVLTPPSNSVAGQRTSIAAEITNAKAFTYSFKLKLIGENSPCIPVEVATSSPLSFVPTWPGPYRAKVKATGCDGTVLKQNVEFTVAPSWMWIRVWRGVMLVGILLFVLPYALPAREIVDPCCFGPSWQHFFIRMFAIGIVIELLIVLAQFIYRGWQQRTAIGPKHSASKNRGETRWGYWALALVVLVTGGYTLYWWAHNEPQERLFLYVRATDMAAGLSPLVPMGLLGLAAFALGRFCLKQADLHRRTQLKCPYPKGWRCDKLLKADHTLNNGFQNHLGFTFDSDSRGILLLLGAPFLLCVIWNVLIIPLPSGEGTSWDWIMRAAFWMTAGAVVLVLIRFLALWGQLKRLLDEILRFPMVSAFELVPREIARQFKGYLYFKQLHHFHLKAAAWALPVKQRLELADGYAETHDSLEDGATKPEQYSEEYELKKVANQLKGYANQFLSDLESKWAVHTIDDAFGIDRPRKEEEHSGEREEPKDISIAQKDEPTTAQKENYIASYVTLYLSGYFVQLRMLVYAFSFAAPLLLFTVSSYAFQPEKPWLAAVIVLLAIAAICAFSVFYQINKNGLVSRIMRTTPNKFTPDWGFVSSLMTYVLPVLGLVLLQVLGLFRSVFEPILGLIQ